MRSTLFYIPHELWGIPLFGLGWCLGLIVLGLLGWIAWCVWKHRPVQDWLNSLPLFAMVAAIVVFVLPAVEQRWPDGSAIGLPIRGYGIMVLLGLVCGVALSAYRGKSLGVSADTIVGLGFWMMLIGVLGARTFYVLQKWQDFQSWTEIFKLTEGGLVIYGGVLGGLIAGAVYCIKHHLKITAMADLIAPGFLLGLAFGRIGCLLHGCCFGGVCESDLPSMRFPHGSVPYQAQLATGRILGIKTESVKLPSKIVHVETGSEAEQAGISEGQILESLAIDGVLPSKDTDPTKPADLYAQLIVDGKAVTFGPSRMPETSLPTHPSQVYSAINALLLCGLLWLIQPLPSRDGITFLIGIALYAISRFLLEGIRSDEAGQLGTTLTIAQWIGMLCFVLAIAGMFVIGRGPKGRCWDWKPSEA